MPFLSLIFCYRFTVYSADSYPAWRNTSVCAIDLGKI